MAYTVCILYFVSACQSQHSLPFLKSRKSRLRGLNVYGPPNRATPILLRVTALVHSFTLLSLADIHIECASGDAASHLHFIPCCACTSVTCEACTRPCSRIHYSALTVHISTPDDMTLDASACPAKLPLSAGTWLLRLLCLYNFLGVSFCISGTIYVLTPGFSAACCLQRLLQTLSLAAATTHRC